MMIGKRQMNNDTISVRHAVSPDAARTLDTDGLRAQFLVETLFSPGALHMVYTHYDRMVLVGAMPQETPLNLGAPKPIGQAHFFDAREGGVINIGGAGRVILDGVAHELHGNAALYIGMSTKDVRFESVDAAQPACFYLVSAPAHKALPSRLINAAQANKIEAGTQATANQREIMQFLHPDVTETCQLTMGMTRLACGNVWNTMPAHTHDRRSEVYLYFDMPKDQRVFHLMGEPTQTRHLVVADKEAVLSPSWSIHAGTGTSNYAFIWAMAGDNKDFTDMDHLAIGDLR